MSKAVAGILQALDERVEAMASACTRCGKCVEVCPMPGPAEVDVSEPGRIISGVLDVLRSGEGNAQGNGDAERWARACSGSGFCIDACPEGINPRFLLAMARRTLHKRNDADARRKAGRGLFQRMSRGVKVLSRLQLSPDLLDRLSPSSHPKTGQPPELIFYTGCNLLKTPHIGLLCLDVLDRLDVRYEVHGGPSSCCGILQARGGDDVNALRQGSRTVQRFAQTAAPQVLSWCPTCQIQFQETTIPVQLDGLAPVVPEFDLSMFPVYLASRLDDLRPHMVHPVEKRVALHGHPGAAGVTASVLALLRAIPGLEVVDLDVPPIGYTLGSLAAVPDERNRLLAGELAAAEAAKVTTLAGIYHSDHRELAAHESEWPFEIINFMELIGESMGVFREDSFKRLKTMRDVDAIIEDAKTMIALNGLDLDEVRDVVMRDLIDEQLLPVDREAHASYTGAS